MRNRLCWGLLAVVGCGGHVVGDETSSETAMEATEVGASDGTSGDGDGTSADGDGTSADGDGTSGDGDETSGDGDGTSGDGDGTSGDGDGTSGDGDGTSGDGDGTSGDGDGTSGDGDGTSGDGDGTSGDGDGTSGDGDGTSGDGDGTSGDGDGTSGDGDGTSGDGDGTVCWGAPGDPTWPGPWTTVAVDDGGIGLGNNLSGVVWDWSDDSIWVVMNGPSYLRRLQWVPGAQEWQIHPSWPTNGILQYPGGTGEPDSEGVTLDATGSLLVSTERDNANSGVSRLSVLRYDVSAGPGILPATTEWDLTATLAGEGVSVGANGGLEAITFLPDATMTSLGLFDEVGGAAYDPSALAPHLGGLVAVGVEEIGDVLVLSLFEDGSHALVARFNPGLARIMSLEWDPEIQRLWAGCDNNCGNAMSVLRIDPNAGATQGRFIVERALDRPVGLADDNNEGFAVGPSGMQLFDRKVLWTRDGGGNGTSIWQGQINEGPPCE